MRGNEYKHEGNDLDPGPEPSDEDIEYMNSPELARVHELEYQAEGRLLAADASKLARAAAGTAKSLVAPAPLDTGLTRLTDFILEKRARVIAPPLPRLQPVALTARLLPVPFSAWR